MEQIVCNLCNTSITNKKDLTKHQRTKKCQEMNQLVILKNNIYTNQITEYKSEISKLLENNIILKKQLEDKDKQIKLLQEKSEEYRKIVEKAATKTTIKNNNNYNHNNYLNYISSEPLKFKEIKEQAKKYINSVSVMYDDDDFHDHIVDNILKDKSGKDKVLCTDINRKNFTYKDETSGEMIYDPELERLREQLKKGTDIRQIRSELLEKLVSEYEENGNVGIDPFKQFSDIIKKLNFGNPFIDHVAKKTYVKRCTSLKTKDTDLESIENKEDNINESKNDNINESNCEDSFDEEEYQMLLKEFGNESN